MKLIDDKLGISKRSDVLSHPGLKSVISSVVPATQSEDIGIQNTIFRRSWMLWI